MRLSHLGYLCKLNTLMRIKPKNVSLLLSKFRRLVIELTKLSIYILFFSRPQKLFNIDLICAKNLVSQ